MVTQDGKEKRRRRPNSARKSSRRAKPRAGLDMSVVDLEMKAEIHGIDKSQLQSSQVEAPGMIEKEDSNLMSDRSGLLCFYQTEQKVLQYYEIT